MVGIIFAIFQLLVEDVCLLLVGWDICMLLREYRLMSVLFVFLFFNLRTSFYGNICA